ncbi:MAG: host specificity protein J [Amylibacter sp.]
MPRLVNDELFGREPDKRAIDPDLISGGLRSKQFATVVDLLGFGEISGFRTIQNTSFESIESLNVGKDIFLDGTPLVDANGNSNFDDVEVFFRNGTTDQTPLGSIDSFGPDRIENTTSVGVAVTKSTSVSRSITGVQDADGNELIKMIRVTLQLPSLQEFQSSGDIVGAEVSISIRLTENGGTIHNPVVEDVISGKASSPYLKDYEIDLESNNLQFPLTVTVIRNTDDSTDGKLFNDTNFLLLTTIIPESQAYQGFAYVALRFNAQSFQNFPRRMYRVKGTKIKIPHNGTVDLDNGAISYSGDFDGTFKADKEWSSDPAWILYDLLTTDKGFGGSDGVISEDSLDVFSFFTASKYASTIIQDPITGTTEPRFSCNVILNQKNDAYTIINDLCSVMNSMPFYSVGTLQIGQDRPTNTTTNTSDAQYLFTNANVKEDGFNYSGSGQRTKFTEVEISYFDNDTQQIDYEVVTASEITALASFPSKYGKTRKTIKAFACTSRGQANRLGRWFLYTNLRETEICTFTTTLEAGVIVRPSMVIGIADSMRAGVRRGGRIKSVGTATITDPDTGITTETSTVEVDDANNTDLTTTNSATLSVILSDGTVESRVINSISDKTITVSSAFSSPPQANSIWAIENTTTEFQTYRVISIKENNETEYTITAIIHDVDKYAQVEDTTVAAQPRNITTLLDVKPAPSNLTAIENIVELNNRAVAKIFVSWQPVQGVKEYRVESQYENDSVEVFRVSRPDFEIFESRSGTYKFKVQSYNALGVLSTEASSIDNFQASGKTALPVDVQNLRVETLSDQLIRLRFDKSTDTDVVHGGNVIVRHSSLTDGTATFTNSVNLIAELAGSVSETILPALDGEYILKFRDDGGRFSSGEASVVVSNPDPKPKLLVLSDREDTDSTPFNGTKTDCFFSSDLNGLVLGSTVKLDDASVSDFNAIQNFDFLDQNSTTDGGSYEFENILDIGSAHPLRLKRHLTAQGFYPSDFFDERSADLDSWDSFAALVAFSVNAKLTCAVTSAAPSNGSSYQDSDFTGKTFNTFANGTLIGRGFKFKLEMSSTDPAQSIEIVQLGYIAELERRTEQKSNLSSGTSSSGLAVTFDNTFFTGASGTSVSADSQKPSIGITANDLGGTDRFEITNISGSGFTIKFQNAGNAVIDKTFSYTAVGFGRGT